MTQVTETEESSIDAREAPPNSDQIPFVSVVIPVRNEAAFLGSTLDQLLEQDYPADHWEVIVVDGDSDDTTWQIAEAYAARHQHVNCYRNPKRWSSAARNIGIRAAQGDVVVIVDGHCQITQRDLIRQLARTFRDPETACVGRPQPLDVEGATPMQRAIAAARSCWMGHHPDSFIYSDEEQVVPAHSVAVAYRASLFDRVGYFDESFDACEDVEFNHRVDQHQLRCVLQPRVAVHYHPRASLFGMFRQLVRYGRGRIRLLRKHRDTLSIKTLTPAAWLLYILMLPLVVVMPNWLRGLYLAGLAVYVIALFGTTLALVFSHRNSKLLFYAPIVIVTIHAATGWGLLRELLWRHRPAMPTRQDSTPTTSNAS